MNEYTEDFLNPVSCSTSRIVSSLSILLLLTRLDDRTFRNGTLERLTHEYPNGVPQNPDGNLFLDFLIITPAKVLSKVNPDLLSQNASQIHEIQSLIHFNSGYRFFNFRTSFVTVFQRHLLAFGPFATKILASLRLPTEAIFSLDRTYDSY